MKVRRERVRGREDVGLGGGVEAEVGGGGDARHRGRAIGIDPIREDEGQGQGEGAGGETVPRGHGVGCAASGLDRAPGPHERTAGVVHGVREVLVSTF